MELTPEKHRKRVLGLKSRACDTIKWASGVSADGVMNVEGAKGEVGHAQVGDRSSAKQAETYHPEDNISRLVGHTQESCLKQPATNIP